MGRKKKNTEEEIVNTEKKPEIILGLDVSTTTIGCAIILNDGSDYGQIIELTHVAPKVSSRLEHTIEALFIKKKIFETEFLSKWKDKGISKVVIEEPLISSNNAVTVATLLRFNGMISDCVYNMLGIVPQYISSYDARKYAFPEFVTIRKFGKDGKQYPLIKLEHALRKNQFVLFGNLPWDCPKKNVLWDKVSTIFPQIEWLYDNKGELKKENFDATDAYVAGLGVINQERYKDLEMISSNIEIKDKVIEYDVSYWNRTEHRILYLPMIENENGE